jgi:hypothetical protein
VAPAPLSVHSGQDVLRSGRRPRMLVGMDHRELSDRVERAGGVVRARDVVGPGVARSTFYDLARRDGWQSPFAGAWMPPHLALDGFARARGVLASLGHDEAWLARGTVLWLLGLLKKPPADVQ